MKQLFINLPVKDVEASMHFYAQLGLAVNPLFTFDDQKCMVLNEQLFLMLQTHEMFKKGNTKNLADARHYSIATFTLPVESVDKVNELMEKGLKAGGRETSLPKDEGFMLIRNLEDPDGHQWAIIYLDIEKFKKMTGKV